jgi:DNA/RNA-binding domain of Phe-tRNA-synthetase-like protein
MIYVHNNLPRDDTALGIVRAESLTVARMPPGFEARLDALLATRTAPLNETREAVRKAARDVLRNGRYKPTGRGKPASEYLLRSAQQEGPAFPRINAPVDVANYVSLQTLLPVSLWDLDLAGVARFAFRLGRPGEAYAFNTAGQTILLDDLVVGCCLVDEEDDGRPIVNPVKDSLATKTTDQTRRVAACVYTPLAVVSPDELTAICAAFAAWLAGCGDAVETAYAVVLPRELRSV